MRLAAVIAVCVGAVGSLGLMFFAGRHQQSVVLIALFGLWVLAPFALAASLETFPRIRHRFASPTLYLVIVSVALGSLAVYAAFVAGVFKAKTGFIFLIVPLVSLLVLATTAVISARRPQT